MSTEKKLLIAIGVVVVAYIAYGVVAARFLAKPRHLLGAIKGGKRKSMEYVLLVHPEFLNKPMGPRGGPPLHYAAGAHRPNAADLLLNNGARVNARGAYGQSALHRVIAERPRREGQADARERVLDLLLEKGAEKGATDAFGQTPLHLAAREGWEAGIVALLPAGLEERTNAGETPLHTLAYSGSTDCLRMLLDNGADPNARDSRGWTALHNAVAWGAAEHAALLLERGADPTMEGKAAMSPLELAGRWDEDAMLQVFRDHCAPEELRVVEQARQAAALAREDEGAEPEETPTEYTIYEEWPFDSKEAQRRQEETARQLDLPVKRQLKPSAGLEMELVLIPAGEFMMGSPPDEEGRKEDEGPQHRVRLTRPFYMAGTEVTIEQYRAFLLDGGDYSGVRWDNMYCPLQKTPEYPLKGEDVGRKVGQPIVMVNWFGAEAFCDWLSRKTGNKVRLPTEAEWEYACRAGTGTAYEWGDEWSAGRCMAENDMGSMDEGVDYYRENGIPVGSTVVVGTFEPNAWGLYDMHGNAWEWCADRYHGDYYSLSPLENPPGDRHGVGRVLRSGSWAWSADYCRSACRRYGSDDRPTLCTGFRVVIEVIE